MKLIELVPGRWIYAVALAVGPMLAALAMLGLAGAIVGIMRLVERWR